ncbi:hypothetical protein F5884DRAFT_752245 [Xylogone sp. PMI_703]|nr:hypothetical protein F5884DRAFT_752245 [Xylogone sp. PMI_703]
MEQLHRKLHAESGPKFFDRAFSGLSIQRANTPTSFASESSKEGSLDSKDESKEDLKGPLGLTLLHAPSEPIIDFIFIHGLGGGSRKTWSKTTSPYHYWPKEWLPLEPDFQHVRIHAFGYKADWGERQDSVLDFNDFARSLLGDIKDSPNIRRSDTMIVLIGHSMGGIVMKKAYIQARQDPSFQDLSTRFHTFYFLATPHRGSDLARTLHNVLKITYGHKPFVSDLERNSGLISSINDSFRHYADDLQICSFYETLKSSALLVDTMIVDKGSATLGYPHERIAPLDANHRGIVKYDKPSDPNYITLRNAFISTIDDIMNRVFEHQQEASRNELQYLRSLTGCTESQESDLNALDEIRMKDSCQWFSSKQEFQYWANPTSKSAPIFWLTGNPATGKSILASHVINQLQTKKHRYSYFFFQQGTKGRYSVSDLLSSLAYQMALGDAEIRRRLLIETDGAGFESRDERVIWRKLFVGGIFQAKKFRPHYWIIDGLDECNKAQSLFSMLSKVNGDIPLRVFITSRKTAAIERGMSELGKQIMEQEIQVSDTMNDIKSFIESRMDQLPVEDWDGRSSLAQKILDKASGSFLWVRLIVRELEGTYSEEAAMDVLEKIPPDMNILYARTLESLSNAARGTNIAKTILTWTVCTSRPLTVEEMQAAIKIDINETVHNLEKLAPSICGQLVFVDQQSRIQIIHQTAKDYLLNKNDNPAFEIKRGEAHMRLAVKCLELLSGDSLKPSRTRLKKTNKSGIPKDSALIGYASAFFSDHLYKSSSADPETTDALYDFLATNVLGWIEYLAKTGDISYVTRTATNIKAYLERRSKYYPPIGKQIQTIEAWVIDLIRVSAGFRTKLLASPRSIHWLIPPMCPAESIIHKTHTSLHRGLSVKGIKPATWDDCLIRIDYRDSKATSISHGEQHFVVGLSTGSVILYYADSGRVKFDLHHKERVKLVEISNHDKMLASSGLHYIRVWDVSTGQQLWTFNTPRCAMALAFSNDNEVLMAATQGNYVTSYALENDGEVEQVSWQDAGADGPVKPMYRQIPSLVTFSSERDLIAIAYRGRPITLFNLDSETFFGHCIRPNGSPTHDPISDMVFNPNPDINLLIVSYHDGELAVYNPWDVELVYALPGVNAHMLACSPDGRTLVTGSAFGTIQIFDCSGSDGATLTLLYRINAYEEGIRSLAFSVDNSRFMDIRGSQCRVWEPAVLVRKDLEDGTQSELSDPLPHDPKNVGMLEGEGDADITALVCHPSGDIAFCGKQNGFVASYSVKDGQQAQILYRHETDIAVTAIAFGATSSILISADEAGRIIVNQLDISGANCSVLTLGDIRFGDSVIELLLSPSSDLFLVNGRNKEELWTVDCKKMQTRDRAGRHSGRAIQHPLESSSFILMDHMTARIYLWEDFGELSVKEGARITRHESINANVPLSAPIYGQETLVRNIDLAGNQKSVQLECWQASSLRTNNGIIDLLPGFEYLEDKINMIIAVAENILMFLDTDLWVCSLDLKTFADTQQLKRHFFIPSDWQAGSGQMLFQLTSKNDFVFAKRSELVVISRGLDFSETILLKETIALP